MPTYFPANHTVTKILTEAKIRLTLNASVVNRLNYLNSLCFGYLPNSVLHIPNALVRVHDDPSEEIEVLKDSKDLNDLPYAHLELLSTWYSQSTYKNRDDLWLEINNYVKKEVMSEKRRSMGVEFLNEESEEELVLALELTDLLLAKLSYTINETTGAAIIAVNFGGLEEDIGYWLIDIVKSVLSNQ